MSSQFCSINTFPIDFHFYCLFYATVASHLSSDWRCRGFNIFLTHFPMDKCKGKKWKIFSCLHSIWCLHLCRCRPAVGVGSQNEDTNGICLDRDGCVHCDRTEIGKLCERWLLMMCVGIGDHYIVMMTITATMMMMCYKILHRPVKCQSILLWLCARIYAEAENGFWCVRHSIPCDDGRVVRAHDFVSIRFSRQWRWCFAWVSANSFCVIVGFRNWTMALDAKCS